MKIIVLIVMLSLLFCKGWPQEFPELRFSHIREKDGLSNARVSCIVQDRQGFIWAGTQDGLNRLDGYRVKKIFRIPADSNSLVNNNILSITPDGNNNLWISTIEGVSYYQAASNHFTNFQHKSGNAFSLRSDRAAAVYVDTGTNDTWLSGPMSIYHLNHRFQFSYIPCDTSLLPPAFSTQMLQYRSIYKDRGSAFWSFSTNWLFRLDARTKQIIRAFYTGEAFIKAFYQDNNGNYWIGTYGGGLLLFDVATACVKKIVLPQDANHIYAINEWKDKNNHHWLVVGTSVGLLLLDPVTRNSHLYVFQQLDDGAVSNGDIMDLFVDRENILWMATENGISYIDPTRQAIDAWSIVPDSSKIKDARRGFAYSFLEDTSGYWAGNWIKAGLFRYDKYGKMIRHIPVLFPAADKVLKTGTTQAFDIIKDADGSCWFTTDAGIIHRNLSTNTAEFYTPDEGNLHIGLRNIIQYDANTWWIRTRNNGANGIYVFNHVQKKFTHHYQAKPYLHDLVITRDHHIYIAPSDNYLYVFDEKKNEFMPAMTDEKQLSLLPGKSFECIAEDDEGYLWIGTSNGIFQFDPRHKNIVTDFSKDKTIGGIAISRLCFDEKGNLWIATERGLFCLEHTTKQVFHFGTRDGLPDNSLPGFLAKGYNGYMYAGALGYIIRFTPAALLHRHRTGEAAFSELAVMNQPVPVTKDKTGKTQIQMNNGSSMLSVDFSIMNYDNMAGNRYYYWLEGGMSDWTENDNGHLNFYNLPNGRYILHVKGGDKYSGPLSGEALLFIEVVPRWWQTKWFYTGLLLLAGCIVFIAVRNRISNIRRQAILKGRIADSEMMALRAQMNPHFIFNCMNIIDGLVTGNRKKDAKEFLQKFSKLTRLVLENSQYQLVPLAQDVKALKLYVEVEAIRYNDRFSYTFTVDPSLNDNHYKIPPLLLQPYVENAIVHGLRHKENGHGKLSVAITKQTGFFLITIEDNGIGRAASSGINARNNPLSQHQQMGMKITGKRIELLKIINPGDISVVIADLDTDTQTGTRVTIRLPLEFKKMNTLQP